MIFLYFVMHRQNTVLKRKCLRKNILFRERIHCLTTAMSRIQLYDMNIKNSYYKKDYCSTLQLSIFLLEVCSTTFYKKKTHHEVDLIMTYVAYERYGSCVIFILTEVFIKMCKCSRSYLCYRKAKYIKHTILMLRICYRMNIIIISIFFVCHSCTNCISYCSAY